MAIRNVLIGVSSAILLAGCVVQQQVVVLPDRARPMTEDDIYRSFSGWAWNYEVPASDLTGTASYFIDGTLHDVFRQGEAEPQILVGSWRVEDDRRCESSARSTPEDCFVLYRDGNTIFEFTDDGTYHSTLTLAQ